MNTRQIKLIEFLNEQDDYINLKSILRHLSPSVYFSDDSYAHYSERACYRLLKADIKQIKENYNESVLISNTKRGVKFANEDEALIYIKKEYRDIKKRLNRINAQKKSYNALANLNIEQLSFDNLIDKL